MTGLVPPAPKPKPIDKISPSLGENLISCALRAAFARDHDFADLNRGSPFSALGLVSHALTEEFAHGEFSGLEPRKLKAALEDRFDELVDTELQSLRKARPAVQLPPPERWPGYRPTRRRLLRRLAGSRAGATSRESSLVGSVTVEGQIEAPDLPLFGRPDRIERDERGTHLIDLKTGWGEMSELRPAHRRQLLIYAYIWHAIHGEWPVSAVIQRLDGSRLPLEVDPVEAKAIVDDLLARRQSFNDAIGVEAWALASPSPDACEKCAYRAACPPFFTALNEKWGNYRRSLLGHVSAIDTFEGSLVLELSVDAGDLPSEVERARILRAPSELELELDEAVAVVDAVPTRIASELRLAWDSDVYSWSRGVVIA